MIDLISKLNPWRRIRELEAEVENLTESVEAESVEAQYWYAKAFQFKEDLQKSNQRNAELARDVEIHKDNAAELEMCVDELKQKLAEALKNDKRGKDGRYTK